ncbi:PML-RARA-regulated adapter molecule 1 [Sminthopsis crassicaudata]|uniref:PML-RARA-regulated adapter molecule 1 n=1 Tax=Sminthopsis crassicaudata TaxID=9301 RepID=UPI003D684FB6
MESHQDFQNLKAKFQGLQTGFSELPKKPPLPKGSQVPGLARVHPVSESSSPSGASATNHKGPPWQGQGASPSPWLPNLGRGSQASPRTREAPRDQQPPWKIAGNVGEKASSPSSPIPLSSSRTPRKEPAPSVPRRKPLPPLKTLGPQPPKPPLPPGILNLEQFRRKAIIHKRPTGEKTILSKKNQVTALQKPGSFSSGGRLGPLAPPISQDPDEIYDDVEPNPCPPGPKRRDDLLAAERTLKDFQRPGRQLWNSWKPAEKANTEEISNPLKQHKKEEKAEREFRKKFKFEGDIVTLTRMMIDPNAKTRRGGGRNLAIRRGEIMDVIQFTSKEQILCRDVSGKYGFIPRRALLPLETEVYDDVCF